jgi:hypothetical protein
MEITPADEGRAVSLLTHDVEVTLGTGQEDFIRHEASVFRAMYNAPDIVPVDSQEYLEKVAEEVQQHFHDWHIDTTWPECPLHRRHPLWVHDGSWTCEQLNLPVAALGELQASHDSSGRYVIRANLSHEDPG